MELLYPHNPNNSEIFLAMVWDVWIGEGGGVRMVGREGRVRMVERGEVERTLMVESGEGSGWLGEVRGPLVERGEGERALMVERGEGPVVFYLTT